MINSTTINHTQSFDVVNGVENANMATREIFENIAWEQVDQFEGMMLRNSFIASNDYEGGMNASVTPSTVSMNNPAGSFRSVLTPKGRTQEFKAIESLGDVKFNKFSSDTITLEIDTYITSGIDLIYEVDGATNSWLVDDIKSVASGRAISDIVREINYETYRVIKNGALEQIDPVLGAQGRVAKASIDSKEFTNELIEDIAKIKALPQDRYVSGFLEGELAIAMAPTGHSKLLQEKLVIFDGQFKGTDGKFFTGLPYTHRFAGVALVETRFMNDGLVDGFEYIGMPVGKWSPFLFHLARFAGRAEVMPGTDGALGIYGTSLYGMKIEQKLSQYIFAEQLETPVQKFTTNLIQPTVKSENAGELTLAYVSATEDVLYRVTKVGATAGSWTKMDTNPLTVSGLDSASIYNVEFASAKTGELVPEQSANETKFIITKIAKTL